MYRIIFSQGDQENSSNFHSPNSKVSRLPSLDSGRTILSDITSTRNLPSISRTSSLVKSNSSRSSSFSLALGLSGSLQGSPTEITQNFYQTTHITNNQVNHFNLTNNMLNVTINPTPVSVSSLTVSIAGPAEPTSARKRKSAGNYLKYVLCHILGLPEISKPYITASEVDRIISSNQSIDLTKFHYEDDVVQLIGSDRYLVYDRVTLEKLTNLSKTSVNSYRQHVKQGKVYHQPNRPLLIDTTTMEAAVKADIEKCDNLGNCLDISELRTKLEEIVEAYRYAKQLPPLNKGISIKQTKRIAKKFNIVFVKGR